MEKKKSFAYGWSLVVSWFLSWAVYNFANTVSVAYYRDQVAAVHGYTTVAALDMSTWAGIVVSIAFLVVPKMLKKFGARTVTLIGYLGTGICYALTPYAPTSWMLGVMIALTTLFSGMGIIIPTQELAGRWFPRRKGFVMGIMTSAGIVATGVLLPVYTALQAAMGVTQTMMIFGVVFAIYGVICFFWTKETPESMGLDPDGMPMTDEDREKLRMATAKNENNPWTYKALLTNRTFWIFAIGWLFEFIAIGGFANGYVSYLVSVGIGTTTIVAWASMFGILSAGASILSGFLDTKIGNVNAAIVVLAVQFVCLMVMFLGGHTLAGTIILLAVAIQMASCGCPNNLQPSQGMDLLGPRNYSNCLILLQIINSGRMFGNWILARSLSWTGAYEGAIAVFAVLIVIGAVLIKIAGNKPIPVPKSAKTADAE